jgi:hypothetical protein
VWLKRLWKASAAAYPLSGVMKDVSFPFLHSFTFVHALNVFVSFHLSSPSTKKMRLRKSELDKKTMLFLETTCIGSQIDTGPEMDSTAPQSRW